MGITNNQELAEKKQESQPWTITRLFPFAGVATSLSKVFISPFEILLGYLIIILGIAELLGRKTSPAVWALAVLLLVAAFFERGKEPPKEEKKKDKK